MAAKQDFNVRDWLADLLKDQNIPEDRRKVVEEVLVADAVAGRVREAALRQADYSRQTQEIAADRKRMEHEVVAAREKYEAGYSSVAQWKADQEKVIGQWKERLAEADAERERLAAAVERAKKDGLSDADLGLDKPVMRKTRAEEATVDPARFVSREDFQKERATLNDVVTGFPSALLDLYSKHQALFPGQPCDMTALVAQARKQDRAVEEVWSEKYHVPERVQEIQKAALDKQLQEAKDAGLKEGRETAIREFSSGQMVPGTPGGRPTTLGPVFQVDDVKKQLNSGDPGAPNVDPVMRAVEAFRLGTYAAKTA